MNITHHHWKTIKDILNQYPYKFYLFGSRIKGSAKEFSDLDICYKEKILDSVIGEIAEKFDQSDLPYTVDLVAWWRCTDEFKSLIKDELILASEFDPA